MPLVRMLVSWGPAAWPIRDRKSNTLYFNVSGSVDDPDYQDLANDLRDIYAALGFTSGSKVEVRAYDMRDPLPRPERAFATVTNTGSSAPGVQQAALCLSYYADRNLPSRRGRIYTGFGIGSNTDYASVAVMDAVIGMANSFAGLGGLNVDWSVYSPKTGENHRIDNAWVDNSWDIIRSRKLRATTRKTVSLNG